MAEKMRLDKLLADTGLWSRKEVRELVKRGAVTLNGVPVRKPEEKADPAEAAITVNGQPLVWRKYSYYMMNKPAGLLSATEDSRQKTVLDLLPQEERSRGVFPVGRLDKDTEGLLLLTNDGELAHRLLSPRHHVDKLYLAQTEGQTDESDVRAFAEGMTLGDGLNCMPAVLEPLPDGWCHVTLREGKFHQVKRMLAARGKPVLFLKRLQMGPLILDETLETGSFRPLTETEIAQLLSL